LQSEFRKNFGSTHVHAAAIEDTEATGEFGEE
jgi:hypothetical protein